MNLHRRSIAYLARAVAFGFLAAICSPTAPAQTPEPVSVPTLRLSPPFIPLEHYGPYNAHILVGGRGLTKALPPRDPLLEPSAPWTLSAWVEFAPVSPSSIPITGVGDPLDHDFRFFALVNGRPALRLGDA